MANSAEIVLNQLKPSPSFAPFLYGVLKLVAANPGALASTNNPATDVISYCESIMGRCEASLDIKRQLTALQLTYARQGA
jgi:hypothetical protein